MYVRACIKVCVVPAWTLLDCYLTVIQRCYLVPTVVQYIYILDQWMGNDFVVVCTLNYENASSLWAVLELPCLLFTDFYW